MKREWLLALAVTVLTLGLVLALVRFFAPGLLGVRPKDLELVRLSTERPAFYRVVFDEAGAGDLLVNDPVVRVRGRPLLPDGGGFGPHDVLGFRNSDVPSRADIVVLGDSQTYGNNASLMQTWPLRLEALLGQDRPFRVYSMAVGGWSAAQYHEQSPYALALHPALLIVAFYSGNDPLETWSMITGQPGYESLKPSSAPTLDEAPTDAARLLDETAWAPALGTVASTRFTPGIRLRSNARWDPNARGGWIVMADVAARIAARARKAGATPWFTLIPTKELVYAAAVAAAGVEPPPAYRTLVDAERRNIDEFRAALGAAGLDYVDVVGPLSSAVVSGERLYPDDENGHPIAAGYDRIAHAIRDAIAPAVPAVRRQPAVVYDAERHPRVVLITESGAWDVADRDILLRNGWPSGLSLVEIDRASLAAYASRGTLSEVDPARFGPLPTSPSR